MKNSTAPRGLSALFQPIDLNDVKEVRAHMPFALVVTASAKAPIPTTLLAEADTCPLGYFDNNLHRHSNRHTGRQKASSASASFRHWRRERYCTIPTSGSANACA